ncbi:MAG: hypothetical protein IJQ58_05170 [Synergistaceae bacterium]|nr:hypothetical protein [Synergistaceae bacterium]
MSKFCSWALLVVLLCTACVAQASEVPSNPFSGFGLYYTYVTSGSVTLKDDGRADYSGVNCFVAGDVLFGGMVKKDYSGTGDLPLGTLTVLSGDSYYQGRNFRLAQSEYRNSNSNGTNPDGTPYTPELSPYAGQFIDYGISNYTNDFLGAMSGNRVMWNIYTSPDVVEGAGVIHEAADMKPINIGKNDIVPFIKVIRDDNSRRYDLYFVRSGDWETPVAANIPVVSVNDREYTDFAKPYPVRTTIGNSYSYYYSTYRISYFKDNAKYTWVFEPETQRYSEIEWRKLDLTKQPLTLKTGTTENITIKLPSVLKLSRDFASEDMKREILTAGNPSVLEVDYDSVNFTQGAGWNEAETSEDKSTLSFTLIAGEPGRSVLAIYIPGARTYYREINVTDESGDLNIPEGTTELHADVTQRVRASYVGGRPYYPSAEEGGMTVNSLSGFTGAELLTGNSESVFYDINGDKHETSNDYSYYSAPSGYAGIRNGSMHEIYRLHATGTSRDVYNFSGGAHFNTADSSDCGEYTSSYLSFGNAKELESVELWLEFPDSTDMNLSSIPLSKLVSLDNVRTIPQQLDDFVPYFELKHVSRDVEHMTSLEWSFVKVKADGTTEKVNPSGISDLNIYAGYTNSVLEGTEGVISMDEGEYWYSGRSITFSYTYNGMSYAWEFSPMGSYYNYDYFSVPDVAPGSSDVAYLTLYDSKDIDGIEAVIWDNDILSASPAKFTSKDLAAGGISFDVKGLKQGVTTISLVLKRSSDGYTSYNRVYKTITVAEKKASTLSNITLAPELRKDYGNFPVVEGTSYYPDNLENGDLVNVRLVVAEKIPSSLFYMNRSNFQGTVYISRDVTPEPVYPDEPDTPESDDNPAPMPDNPAPASGDTETPIIPMSVGAASEYEDEYYLYTYEQYVDEDGIEYITLYYDVPVSLSAGKKIRWEFPGGIIKNGSYTVPEFDILTPAQAKPFVKLNRKGLNLESLEWYFVDSKDSRITEPAGISAISVDVSANYSYSDAQFSDYSKKGYIAVGLPEICVYRVSFSFMRDGITYVYSFEPVDRPVDYYSDDSSRVISWDVDNKNLPLLLYVGESKNVVMSAGSGSRDCIPFIGNSDIAGIETLSSTDKSVTVRLTGKSAGMTTITLMYRPLMVGTSYEPIYDEDGNYMGDTLREYTYYGDAIPTWPREVWVASRNAATGKYEIPGLTDDAETFMKTLASDDTSAGYGWTVYEHEDSGGTSPTPDTPKPTYDESPKDTGLAGLSIMPRFAMPQDPSADAYSAMWDFVDTLGFPYGVSMFDDDNMRVIASRDPVEVFNEMSRDLISGDNPSLVAVVLPEIYINESGFYMFRVPVDNIKGGVRGIFFEPCRSRDIIDSDDPRWYYYSESEKDDMTRQMFVDDDGNPAGAVSGDEYINVAAYFIYGRYTPVITVEATSNDVRIILASGNTTPDVEPVISPDVRPTSPDVTPITSPDVTPTSPDVRPITSPDINPVTSDDTNNNTSNVVPKSVQPDAPRIDVVNNPAHANAARNAITRNNPAIPASVDVKPLPDNATNESRSVSQIPPAQLAMIEAQSMDVVAVMPEMSVDEPAVYTFGVTLDNLEPGEPIYLSMTVTTVTAGFVVATDDEYNSYTFLDDSGNVVTTVPDNQHVNVAAYMEPGKTYSPVITTDASSSSSNTGDNGNSGNSGNNQNPITSSGGGCESGFSLAGMAMLVALLASKRRK